MDEVIAEQGRTEQRRRALPAADTPENGAWFGRPDVNKGERSAFPQARVVGIAECATHAFFDAAGDAAAR